MATAKRVSDKFAQIGYLNVTESAANTLTYAGLSVFSNVLGQKGMVISRAEYLIFGSSRDLLVAADDTITFGLAGSDTATSVSLKDPEIYDYNQLYYDVRGTEGNFRISETVYVKNWTDLPGGGLLVPADRLYAYIKGTSLADVTQMVVRFWFQVDNLTPQEYLELAQAMRVLK